MGDHKPATPQDIGAYAASLHSAIPRMGMSIPMPADTKLPAAPANQQTGSTSQLRGQP